jgi:hypothetical protein
MNAKQEFKAINERLDEIKKAVGILSAEFADKKARLKKICPHLETIAEDDYVSGSYYDRAQFIKRTTCKLCGNVEEEITYGGYG